MHQDSQKDCIKSILPSKLIICVKFYTFVKTLTFPQAKDWRVLRSSLSSMAVVSLISWKLSLSTLLNSINTTVYTCRQKSAQTFENLRNDINKDLNICTYLEKRYWQFFLPLGIISFQNTMTQRVLPHKPTPTMFA